MSRSWVKILSVAGVLVTAVVVYAADPPKPAEAKDKKKAEEDAVLNRAWSELSLGQKRWLLRYAEALREMPKEEQQLINDRFERFLRMSPEEREIMKQNYKRWQKMSPDERQKARDEYVRHRKEYEAKWKEKYPKEPAPPIRFSVSSIPASPGYLDQFQLMILELNLQGPQLDAFQLKLGERVKAIDTWNDSPNGREMAKLEKAFQKAREAKDDAQIKELQAKLKPLQQEYAELRAAQQSEVMSALTLDQQRLWAGYQLYDRVRHRNLRKIDLSDSQAREARNICNEIAAKFVKEDTIANDPFLRTLEKLRSDVADNIKANVLTIEAPPQASAASK